TRHHRVVRAQLARFRGREVDMAGDGGFAPFGGPAPGGAWGGGIRDGLKGRGLVSRAGLPTGVIWTAEGGGGRAPVHIAARICAEANAGEVLVSSTVKDIVAGSGIVFEERGEHELHGVPGSWHLFTAIA